jgi:uncharacterized protein YceK
MRFWIVGVTALAGLLGTAGCATVTSTTGATNQSGPGVTYFLPTRWMRMTATRTVVDLPAAQRARDAARTAMTDAEKDAATAAQKYEGLKKDLEEIAAADTARPGLEEQIAEALEAKTIAEARASWLRRDFAAAASTAAEVETGGAQCIFAAKLELLPAQADPAHRYLAMPFHNPLRDDTSTLKVSANGLLSNANVIAVDRTADILVEAAGAISAFRTPGVRTLVVGGPTPPTCASLPRQIVEIFDPAAGVSGVNQVLKTAEFPLEIDVESAATAAVIGTAATTAPAIPENAGLFYRSPVPILVKIKQQFGTDASGLRQVDAAVVMLPQAGPISYIPLKSSIFVRTVDDVTFTDGVISAWTNERPSELLEFVRLPVKVAQAIISVPAQLLSLRVDYSSQAEALAASQRSQMKATELTRRYAQCLAAGGEDALTRCEED